MRRRGWLHRMEIRAESSVASRGWRFGIWRRVLVSGERELVTMAELARAYGVHPRAIGNRIVRFGVTVYRFRRRNGSLTQGYIDPKEFERRCPVAPRPRQLRKGNASWSC